MSQQSYKTFNESSEWILLLLFFLLPQFGFTQDTTKAKQNLVSIHGFGPGTYYAIHYGRILYTKKHIQLNGKLGFSSFRLRDFEGFFNPDFVFPLGLEITMGKEHKALAGFGNTTSSLVKLQGSNFEKRRDWEQHGYILLGYRYQKKSSPYFFSAAYNLLYERYDSFRNWGLIEIGRFF